MIPRTRSNKIAVLPY